MNKVILMGRLTKDPEVRYTQGANPCAIAKYTLAVNRRFKRDNEPSADFIVCIAFGKNGEFAEKYLRKGQQIAIHGRIQTEQWEDKDKNKRYATNIIVEEHYFCGSKDNTVTTSVNTSADTMFYATEAGDVVDDDFPFR